MKYLISFFIVSLVGCAEEPLTWKQMLHNQTHPYINEDGQLAFNVECRDPYVCLTLAGMRCPHGYVKSGEQTLYKHEWSFSANGWGASGGGHKWSEMRFNVVCK